MDKPEERQARNAYLDALKFALAAQTPISTTESKPLITTKKEYSSYEAERLDLVLMELAREIESDCPNWTYVDALNREFEYWQGRQPGPIIYKTIWDVFK